MHLNFFIDRFSGPDRAVGRLCVTVCVSGRKLSFLDVCILSYCRICCFMSELVMAALRNRVGHYIFALRFLFSIYLLPFLQRAAILALQALY